MRTFVPISVIVLVVYVFLGMGYAKFAANSDVEFRDLTSIERVHARAGIVAAMPAIAMVRVIQFIFPVKSLALLIVLPFTLGWLFWSYVMYVFWLRLRRRSPIQ